MSRRQKGFTLIEVLLTIVLLAIITSGIMAMFTTFMKSNGDPVVITQAAELAQEKVDQILADKANPAKGFNSVVSAAPAPVPGFPGFTRTVTVGYVNSTSLNTTFALPATNYKNVTVTVTHPAGTVTSTVLIGSY